MKHNCRRGFSLIEMLIALTISVGVGAAMVSLLSSSTRFEERNESQRSARLVARSAVNVLVNDLRMIDPAWGIDSATTTSLRVKSPYAIGMVCDTTAKLTIVLLPVDSVSFATSGYSGIAWRSTGGTYTAVAGGTLATQASFATSACYIAGDSIKPISAPASAPNQKTINATISGTSRTGIKRGTVILLYRRVNFYFANSALAGLTSRTALWRNYLDSGAGASELVAPFDSSAAFNFYISGSSAATGTPPGTLSTLRGFRLFLPGQSENTPRQRIAPETANLTTAVYFLNAAS